MARVRLIKHGITSYNYDLIILTGLTMERLEDAPQMIENTTAKNSKLGKQGFAFFGRFQRSLTPNERPSPTTPFKDFEPTVSLEEHSSAFDFVDKFKPKPKTCPLKLA